MTFLSDIVLRIENELRNCQPLAKINEDVFGDTKEPNPSDVSIVERAYVIRLLRTFPKRCEEIFLLKLANDGAYTINWIEKCDKAYTIDEICDLLGKILKKFQGTDGRSPK